MKVVGFCQMVILTSLPQADYKSHKFLKEHYLSKFHRPNMATEVYNLRQKRTYNMGFKNPQYVQELNCFLYDEKFKISRSSEHFIKAHQKGIHVNFRVCYIIMKLGRFNLVLFSPN